MPLSLLPRNSQILCTRLRAGRFALAASVALLILGHLFLSGALNQGQPKDADLKKPLAEGLKEVKDIKVKESLIIDKKESSILIEVIPK